MYDEIIKHKNHLQDQLWVQDLAGYSRGRRFLIHTLRLLYVVVRELSVGQLTLRAMSLVYTTLISLVPLLAVSFSVLKAFKVQDRVEPFLFEFLTPLGEKGEEIGTTIISFIDNMNVGVLGAVGLSVLFYTVISLIQKIEQTFNYIWHIGDVRSFVRRIADYLSVLMIGPVLVVSALAVTASMVSSTFVQYLIAIDPFGALFYYAGLTVPYLLIITAFTFMYMFIPNTSVKVGPALTGATVAGILWKTAGMLFASFTAGSTKYDAIYSGFAILIMFMIWLYLSWLIFLLGSQIAFFRQYPEYVRPSRGAIKLSSQQKEKLALMAMYWIGKHHYQGHTPLTLAELSAHLGVPAIILAEVLDVLQKNNFIVEVVDPAESYLPAKDLDAILLRELLAVIRSAGDDSIVFGVGAHSQAQTDDVLSRLERACSAELGDLTVRQWIQ
ncbi:YihY family inner membrane protein [Pseudomaricurvus alcaniphilus]|uniref:YihY/virulence factor BrkB family protein n=1 Tax=Pseudomaricurvus alcaniphilus TaxID=1166482 RepID=UPI0014078691|nr:YihY/virulence factor BrkB family protein [Pseudomaricurvus alcaniphilus]NHN36303.1 YihY family inner membrane protein [Pseudomaricurvus alcaniphilus]